MKTCEVCNKELKGMYYLFEAFGFDFYVCPVCKQEDDKLYAIQELWDRPKMKTLQ